MPVKLHTFTDKIFRGDNVESIVIENVSFPDNPRFAAVWPSKYSKGNIPIPTKLDRWILSKLSAITALTPYKLNIYVDDLCMGHK